MVIITMASLSQLSFQLVLKGYFFMCSTQFSQVLNLVKLTSKNHAKSKNK